jgi:ubiquitin-like 1-activating enzyme E1 A
MSDAAPSKPAPETASEQPSEQTSQNAAGDESDKPVEETTVQPESAPPPDVVPAPDLNGASNVPLMDPTTAMNGFPINADPTMMNVPMDPMQAGMMGVPEMQGMNMQPAQSISADEIALYDRQIRLWGMQAQERIRNANILLIGLKALGTEIAKNLVLAGVGTLTILDHEPVSDDDLGSQFFLSQEQVGQNRADAALPEIQKLNPRVNLFSDPDIVFTKLPEYFSSFDITIATNIPFLALQQINVMCRDFSRRFYAADTHGMFGYIFSDLIMHQFVVEEQTSNISKKPNTIETNTRSVVAVEQKTENGKHIDIVTKQELYNPLVLVNSSPLPAQFTQTMAKRRKVTPLLSCLRAVFDFQQLQGGRLPGGNRADLELFTRLANEKHLELQLPADTLRADFLRAFLQNLGSEISPAAAFVGGALAQDVINVLGGREQPLQNFLLFDGENFTSNIFSIHPVFDDSMAAGMDMSNMNGAADMSGVGLQGNGTGTGVGLNMMNGIDGTAGQGATTAA